MEKQIIDIASDLESIIPSERARLVGLCTVLTGDRDVAEDLAQETLLEAWRHMQKLRDPERYSQWLSGIARNMCLRWRREHGYDLAHLMPPIATTEGTSSSLTAIEETLADDTDLEIELERKELIELLDKAMALLPPEARTVLVKRYVEESSLAEVAAQLGSNVNAVAMRLQRGKLALRRLFKQELSQEIAPYNPEIAKGEEWEETRIWCWFCGQRRLLGKFAPDKELLLRCPMCCPGQDDLLSENTFPHLFHGLKSYKPAFSRLTTWCHTYYRAALSNGIAPCANCGHPTTVKIEIIENAEHWVWSIGERVINITCPICHARCMTPLECLVLSLPEVRQFCQAHPRIRTLPRQYMERDGRQAIITSFQSVTDNAHFDVVSDYETYSVLHIPDGL